jgi:hypothetical protein
MGKEKPMSRLRWLREAGAMVNFYEDGDTIIICDIFCCDKMGNSAVIGKNDTIFISCPII